jgi:hypothetical protein
MIDTRRIKTEEEKKLLAKLMERDLTLALIAREMKCEPSDGDDLVEAVRLLVAKVTPWPAKHRVSPPTPRPSPVGVVRFSK